MTGRFLLFEEIFDDLFTLSVVGTSFTLDAVDTCAG